MTNVTLILPNYAPDDEVADRAIRFLRSLDESLPYRVKLITVDNGTQEVSQTRSQLLGILKQVSDIYLHTEKPLGYARAVNLGLALAETRYVMVLNNDLTLPPQDWLAMLVGEYESGGCGGPGGILSAMDHPCAPILYDDCWFSLWMSDRETVTRIGYFDEMLPFRFHDQDYAIRAHKLGYKVARTGKVVVGHDEGTTYKKMKLEVNEGVEMERMLGKHGALTYGEWRAMGGKGFGK